MEKITEDDVIEWINANSACKVKGVLKAPFISWVNEKNQRIGDTAITFVKDHKTLVRVEDLGNELQNEKSVDIEYIQCNSLWNIEGNENVPIYYCEQYPSFKKELVDRCLKQTTPDDFIKNLTHTIEQKIEEYRVFNS